MSFLHKNHTDSFLHMFVVCMILLLTNLIIFLFYICLLQSASLLNIIDPFPFTNFTKIGTCQSVKYQKTKFDRYLSNQAAHNSQQQVHHESCHKILSKLILHEFRHTL